LNKTVVADDQRSNCSSNISAAGFYRLIGRGFQIEFGLRFLGFHGPAFTMCSYFVLNSPAARFCVMANITYYVTMGFERG
jgi:hypothetical protein